MEAALEEEVRRKLRFYSSQGPVKLKNGQEMIRRGEPEKGGEFLWGAVASELHGLEILNTGRAKTDHGTMVRNAKKIATQLNDQRLFDAVEQAEKLHSNFYHGFLPKDEFLKATGAAEYAFGRFSELLNAELEKRGIKPGSI